MKKQRDVMFLEHAENLEHALTAVTLTQVVGPLQVKAVFLLRDTLQTDCQHVAVSLNESSSISTT